MSKYWSKIQWPLNNNQDKNKNKELENPFYLGKGKGHWYPI